MMVWKEEVDEIEEAKARTGPVTSQAGYCPVVTWKVWGERDEL